MLPKQTISSGGEVGYILQQTTSFLLNKITVADEHYYHILPKYNLAVLVMLEKVACRGSLRVENSICVYVSQKAKKIASG